MKWFAFWGAVASFIVGSVQPDPAGTLALDLCAGAFAALGILCLALEFRGLRRRARIDKIKRRCEVVKSLPPTFLN